jgi:hypothetical protein
MVDEFAWSNFAIYLSLLMQKSFIAKKRIFMSKKVAKIKIVEKN